MYQSFFRFTSEPFGVTPDPGFFCPLDQHVEASSALYYALSERRGFAALIAPPGLGKTSVVVSLIDRLHQFAEVVFLVHPALDSETLLESVLTGLGVEPGTDRSKRVQQLAVRLAEADRRGRSCAVILDEAQNLTPEALETVRMLSNFEVPGRKLIQFVFVGQPALATLLSRPECEQIRQRINVVARLEPLSSKDVATYIEHRMRVAGAVRNPFTSEAVASIASASAGVPRVINTLCFSSLSLAFADTVHSVSAELVAEAVSDLSLESPIGAAVHSKHRVDDSAATSTCVQYAPAFTLPSRRTGYLPGLVAVLVILVASAAFATFAFGRTAPRANPAVSQPIFTSGAEA